MMSSAALEGYATPATPSNTHRVIQLTNPLLGQIYISHNM